MIESLFALGFVALLGALYAAWSFVEIEALLVLGAKIVAAGLLLGVPTGAWYHVALRRSLARVGALPPRWWLHPTSLHDRIPAQDRTRVLAWCFVGAAGFVVTIAGCVVVALGALRALQSG